MPIRCAQDGWHRASSDALARCLFALARSDIPPESSRNYLKIVPVERSNLFYLLSTRYIGMSSGMNNTVNLQTPLLSTKSPILPLGQFYHTLRCFQK